MNRALTLLLLLASASLAAGESAEQPVALTTRSGSRLYGMLSASQPFMLRSPRGATPLDWSAAKRVRFGERVDPNKENEARNALGDLLHENYETRQKALKQLRELGRVALKPLREMLQAPDPELARQARTLLAELGELGAAAGSGDTVVLKDGTQRRGDITPGAVRFRTRWGYWSVPLDAVDEIEPIPAEKIAVADLAAVSENPAPLPSGKGGGGAHVQMWSPTDAVGGAAGMAALAIDGAGGWIRSMTMLDFDTTLGANKDGRPEVVPLKMGEDLSNVYANRGVLLRLSTPERKPESADAHLNSFSGAQGVIIDTEALWVHIIQPGSFDAARGEGETAGVHVAGAFISASAARSVGLAAYDKSGRLLGQVFNEGVKIPAGKAFGDMDGITELLAVRSAVPISRLRFFKVEDGKKAEPEKPVELKLEALGEDDDPVALVAPPKGVLRIDDLFVDWVVNADRSPDLFGISLRSGERLCGTLKDAHWEKGIKLQAEFLAADAAPLTISSDDVIQFDTPGRRAEPPADKKRARFVIGNQHAVLLQNGEKFHGCFVKIDDKEALFLMSGQVEFRLPRTLLRKIDLQPDFDPQTGRATVSIAEGEKPGVEFRKRERRKDPKDPAKEDEEKEKEKEKEEPGKKKDLLQSQQEMKRMDDAKIVEADLLTGDITVDDGGGDWTIGLAPVKSLVFPLDAEAAAQQPGFREWQIVLRDRSRFDVVPMEMSGETLTVQIARGVVQMPFSVFESLQRKK